MIGRSHVLNAACVGARAGFLPTIQFRAAREKINGAPPSFLIPKLSFNWEVEKSESISYSSARRKLTLLRADAGDTDFEQYASHNPKNPTPRRTQAKCLFPNEEKTRKATGNRVRK